MERPKFTVKLKKTKEKRQVAEYYKTLANVVQ